MFCYLKLIFSQRLFIIPLLIFLKFISHNEHCFIAWGLCNMSRYYILNLDPKYYVIVFWHSLCYVIINFNWWMMTIRLVYMSRGHLFFDKYLELITRSYWIHVKYHNMFIILLEKRSCRNERVFSFLYAARCQNSTPHLHTIWCLDYDRKKCAVNIIEWNIINSIHLGKVN